MPLSTSRQSRFGVFPVANRGTVPFSALYGTPYLYHLAPFWKRIPDGAFCYACAIRSVCEHAANRLLPFCYPTAAHDVGQEALGRSGDLRKAQ
jgi:hypothetical protein